MNSPPTQGTPPPPPPHDGGQVRTRARERWAFRWGLAISLVLHGVVLVVYPMLMDRIDPDHPTPTDEVPDDVIPGFEILTLREVEPMPEDPPEPDDPVVDLPEEEIEPPEPDPPADDPLPVDPPALPPPPVADPAEEEEDPRTLAERLQPGPGDHRLWTFLLPGEAELTDAERATLLLEGMLHQFNDSLAVAAALAEQAQDWTYTDEEGRRWGLSPGRLHLGDFSVPLPISFEVPPGLGNDFGRRDWEIADILRGANQAEIRDAWSQRAREIRERMDAERERNRQGGGGGGA